MDMDNSVGIDNGSGGWAGPRGEKGEKIVFTYKEFTL